VVIGAPGGRDTIQDATGLTGWLSHFCMYYGREYRRRPLHHSYGRYLADGLSLVAQAEAACRKLRQQHRNCPKISS